MADTGSGRFAKRRPTRCLMAVALTYHFHSSYPDDDPLHDEPAVGVHPAEDDLPAPYGALLEDDLPGEAWDEPLDPTGTPSLSIILFSAACGVAGGIIGLYVSYILLQLGVVLSAGLATLALLFSLGISGATLSALSGSRAAPVNILFSCGLILLAFFFLALCAIFGALTGTLLVRL